MGKAVLSGVIAGIVGALIVLMAWYFFSVARVAGMYDLADSDETQCLAAQRAAEAQLQIGSLKGYEEWRDRGAADCSMVELQRSMIR